MKKIILFLISLMTGSLFAETYFGTNVFFLFDVKIEGDTLSSLTELEKEDYVDDFWNQKYSIKKNNGYYIIKSFECNELFYGFKSDDYLLIYRADSSEPVFIGSKTFSHDGFNEVKAICASSELVERGKKYSAANIENCNADAPWVEGKNGYGIGESISFYSVKPYLVILNGFISSRNPDLFYYNSRVKKARFTEITSGKNIVVELKDCMAPQNVDLSEIYLISEESGCFEVRMEILDVYKGEKYDDTCISAIYFNWDK